MGAGGSALLQEDADGTTAARREGFAVVTDEDAPATLR